MQDLDCTESLMLGQMFRPLPSFAVGWDWLLCKTWIVQNIQFGKMMSGWIFLSQIKYRDCRVRRLGWVWWLHKTRIECTGYSVLECQS